MLPIWRNEGDTVHTNYSKQEDPGFSPVIGRIGVFYQDDKFINISPGESNNPYSLGKAYALPITRPRKGNQKRQSPSMKSK